MESNLCKPSNSPPPPPPPPPPRYLLCFVQFQLQPVNLSGVFFIWLKKKKKIKIKVQHSHVQSSPFNSKWHLSDQESPYWFHPSVRALPHSVFELSLSLCTLAGGWPSLVLSGQTTNHCHFSTPSLPQCLWTVPIPVYTSWRLALSCPVWADHQPLPLFYTFPPTVSLNCPYPCVH